MTWIAALEPLGSITQQGFGYLSDSTRIDESIDLGALVVAGPASSAAVRSRDFD